MSRFKPLAWSALAFAAVAASTPLSAQTVLTAVELGAADAHADRDRRRNGAAMLEQKTAGKVKCNLLPRAVSAPPGTFDAVRNGLADLSFTVQGYTPGRFVTTQMAELPFLGDSSEATSVAFQRVYDKYAGHRRTSTRA